MRRAAGHEAIGARPCFGLAERFEADVAAEVELIALDRHRAAVGLAGFWVVKLAAVGVNGVALVESVADLEAAESVVAGFRVGIAEIQSRRCLGADGDRLRANVGTAFEDFYDRACGFAPVAEDAGGRGLLCTGERRKQQGEGDQGAELGHAELDANPARYCSVSASRIEGQRY